MPRLWEKMLLYLGLAEEETAYQKGVKDEATVAYNVRSSHKGKIVNMQAVKNQRVVILKPDDFSEAKIAADHLKSRRAVVINMEEANMEVARRILDFVSGTAYALDANVQKISESIFIFSPENIELTTEFKKKIARQQKEESMPRKKV